MKIEPVGKAIINDAQTKKTLNFVRTEAHAQVKIEDAAYTFVKNQNSCLGLNKSRTVKKSRTVERCLPA